MSEPFFSIITPTYNRGELILNTLQSVFDQTYQNYEVIVVDNCSTDNTEQILQPLIDARKIRFIKHDQNYERARSRNTGMENARGDFVTLLDSDDFMYPDNLSEAVKFIGENPDCKCFQNLYELIDVNHQPIYQYSFPPLDDQLLAIASGNFMSCIGNFLHRDIYNEYRFDTYGDLTGGEDWDFWLRVLSCHKVGRIEKVNNGILQHGTRTVDNQSIEKLANGLNYLVRKFYDDESLAAAYGKYLKRIEASCFLYLNLLANDGKLKGRAFEYLFAALRKDSSVLFTERYLRSLRRTVLGLLKN